MLVRNRSRYIGLPNCRAVSSSLSISGDPSQVSTAQNRAFGLAFAIVQIEKPKNEPTSMIVLAFAAYSVSTSDHELGQPMTLCARPSAAIPS